MSNSVVTAVELQKRMANPVREGYREFDNERDTDSVVQAPLPRPVEDTSLFHERVASVNTITSEQAFVHMVKAMLGTGLLSLPLAFKHAGLFLGLFLTVLICIICLYCMRQVVFAAHFVCNRNGRDLIDYANILRGAVEMGPNWIRHKGYFFKQLLNVNMFVSQLGFCCVYFVFMADNLEDFFNSNTDIKLSKATWMLLLLIPMLSLCSIRRLSMLAPLAMAANFVYIVAVGIVLFFFVSNLKPVGSLPWFGKVADLPLFFGTVMFAFEGVAVIMPIENRMRNPHSFIAWNGVLNSSCLVVLAIFSVTGFYGYLSLGDDVKDTATLNLPMTPFYQTIKLMFVACIMISYPLQFYVPMERVEKWITRKIPVANQTFYIYTVRYAGVFLTCAVAELIPHLALFISLIGAFSGASMALLFPPVIELLTCYAKQELSSKIWAKNIFLLCFAFLGFTTGTYSALSEIFKKIAKE
uniref:Aa_trans domain-containing protein n=1 Tax=Haemonchus contortus TaxID=6289 RepID=A0A7I4YF09_HAECO